MTKNQNAHDNENNELENMLLNADDNNLPSFSNERGEYSYKERYIQIRTLLQPIHSEVEKGALVNSLKEYLKKINESLTGDELEEAIKNIPVIYLNNHGHGHVEKVMERVYGLLSFFEKGSLSPYEIFILLCAIQLHDVGNVFGREEHEKTLQRISKEKCSPFIPDTPERKLIEKIAVAHGGKYNGDKDTISLLKVDEDMKDQKVRTRLLAGLLRFGDEIADDFTRADREGLQQGIVPEESLLFHYFSLALHTVKIEKDKVTSEVYLHLVFEFDSDIATKQFDKFGKKVYLLDEIYERTMKTEQERRYCKRFFKPYLSIERIKVEININDVNDIFHVESIPYVLEEKGYPDVRNEFKFEITGEKLCKAFSKSEVDKDE